MLKHLPCSGMDFLLHIFNLSWSSHSFLSIWKRFSIIPIHKIRKSLNSPASFWSISLTSYVPMLFERIIVSRLLSFLESNFILSPCQAVFHPGRSTLDQILFFLSPFWMGLPNSGRALGQSCRLLISLKLSTLSGIPPLSINSFRLASLLALLVGLNLSFLIGTLAWFIKIRKAVPFESVEVFRKNLFLALFLFSFFINDLPASLPSSVSCSVYADDLAIWSSSPSLPTAMEATQGALFRLERWSEYWFFLSTRANVRAPSFQWIPIKLTSSPTSSY